MLSFKQSCLSAVLSIMLFPLVGQTGAPLLSHYMESTEIENQNWAICQDWNNVMMFANRRGIMTFDGQEWSYVRIPAIPFNLKYCPAERKVFVGGENNYGYLSRSEKGIYTYASLSGDTSDVGLITKIIYTDSTIYFYSEQSVSKHNIKTGDLEVRMTMYNNNPFAGIFINQANTFINVFSEGLFRLEGDTLFPVISGYILADKEILFSLPYNEKLVLLGLSDGNLTLFDGLKFYYYPIADPNYLKQNVLSGGISISDSLYAFSTLDGGALVIEKISGNVRYKINYQNGLPDDEILALGVDNANGLWLSHQYGLTRAELMLPVSNFSIYPGLSGNLINSVYHRNELYVATSEGVFYLDEVKEYAEVEVMVQLDDEPPAAPEPVISEKDKVITDEVTVEETRRPIRNILSRIFRRTTETEPGEKEAVQMEPAEKKTDKDMEVSPQPRFARKTISRLKSVNYVFRKVDGLDEKCKQLVSTPDGILTSTNKGLYVITDHMAGVIVPDRYINFISNGSEDERYYIAADDGYFFVAANEGKWYAGFPDYNFREPLYTIVPANINILWAGSNNAAIRIDLQQGPGYYNYQTVSDYSLEYFTDYVNDTVFVFTENGISYYDTNTDSLILYREGMKETGAGADYVISQPGFPWIKEGEEWLYINTEIRIGRNDRSLLKIFDEIIAIHTDEKNIWIIDNNNQLFSIARGTISTIEPDLALFIKSITNEKGIYFSLTDVVFGRGDNNVYFDIVAPAYLKQNSTRYQYILERVMDDWSKWSTNSTISLMLQPGTYTLHVRAKDIWGNISDPETLTFTIKTPFTRTTVFYAFLSLLLLFLVIMIVRIRERRLQKEKHILEEKVKERTSEIEAQKEEITSSIAYASRIQMAMLPVHEHLNDMFPDYFVIFRPRDLVSGDFYWVGEDENHIFFTVADCTGHGVPGAFMSTLGISTLNEIITNKRNLRADKVLNLLRHRIKNSLHQTGKVGEAADGMDLAFCILHKNRKLLEYAGAYNNLFIAHRGTIKEYKADRMPIGIYVGERESFRNNEIRVYRGDIIYLFTDGFSDQFGGPDGIKYKKSNFMKLLSDICSRPLDQQKKIIEEEFEKWKGDCYQIDDVTILGVKI